MPLFPVVAEELEETERALGIALPPKYKARMLDTRIQKALSYMGSLSPEKRMMDFVALTVTVRATQPAFPREGVVAFCGTGPRGEFTPTRGFPRIWLPDARDPTKLGEMLYAWHPDKCKATKDCTGLTWIGNSVERLRTDHPQEANRIGFTPLAPKAPEKLTTRRVAESVLRALTAKEAPPAGGSDWQLLACLNVKGKYLSVVDAMIEPTVDCANIKVVPGAYDAFVRIGLSSRGSRPIVNALRVVGAGARPDGFGRTLQVDVDAAEIAVIDRQRFFQQVEPDARSIFLMELSEIGERPLLVLAGCDAEVLVVPSGDGDGCYPVRELLQNGRVVGLEVSFELERL